MAGQSCDFLPTAKEILFHYGSERESSVGQGSRVLISHRSIDGIVKVPDGNNAEEYARAHPEQFTDLHNAVEIAHDYAERGNTLCMEPHLRTIRKLGKDLNLEGIEEYIEFLEKRAKEVTR